MAERIVAFELAADGEILRVDMRAGFNIALSETDYLVVATHRLALSDSPGRNLVAGRNRTVNGQVFRFQPDAGQKLLA